MAEYKSIDVNTKPKSFWSRPEGVTGSIFLIGILGALGFFVVSNIAAIATFLSSLLGLVVTLLVLGALIFMILDPKMRALVSYMYKSFMRKITGIFVTIDPIGILKNYVGDLEDNLKKMGKQIGNLRGQMRKLKTTVAENEKEIDHQIRIAKKAKEQSNQNAMLLASRKAGRLRETNEKYVALHKKISVLYKVLTKMYSNSEILLEDTKDQVRVKEQERKAIRTSHSAMKSAMNIIRGNSDKRELFDASMEAIADDVANKIGEMELFMDLSANMMDSIDLQNGVFEEQGLRMLEEYEKQSTLLLLGGTEQQEDILDLNEPRRDAEFIERPKSGDSSYDNLFN